MGPPPFGDGNAHVLGERRPRMAPSMGPPPFGDGNQVRDGSTSPTPNLQWGHRLSAMETGRLSPSSLQAQGQSASWNPSMGPPPFGDGNDCSPQCRRRCPRPSMGPPPFGDGNFDGSHMTFPGTLRSLQWGHRLSAMETCPLAPGKTQCPPWPSMGPPPFGDGNCPLGWVPHQPEGPSMGPPPFGDGNTP